MQLGTTPKPTIDWVPGEADLFTTSLGWLREDRELRRAAEATKGRIRGPRTEPETRDAKTFFEKYDYGPR
jgi:CCR4-NOT complex subunit CAF16